MKFQWESFKKIKTTIVYVCETIFWVDSVHVSHLMEFVDRRTKNICRHPRKQVDHLYKWKPKYRGSR